MATLLGFAIALVESAVDLTIIFVTQVALRDPLSFISFAVGAALTTGAVGFFGLLVAGALADAVGLR